MVGNDEQPTPARPSHIASLHARGKECHPRMGSHFPLARLVARTELRIFVIFDVFVGLQSEGEKKHRCDINAEYSKEKEETKKRERKYSARNLLISVV